MPKKPRKRRSRAERALRRREAQSQVTGTKDERDTQTLPVDAENADSSLTETTDGQHGGGDHLQVPPQIRHLEEVFGDLGVFCSVLGIQPGDLGEDKARESRQSLINIITSKNEKARNVISARRQLLNELKFFAEQAERANSRSQELGPPETHVHVNVGTQPTGDRVAQAAARLGIKLSSEGNGEENADILDGTAGTAKTG